MEKEEIIINDSSVGFVGNPLKSQAVDKILTVSDQIYDTELQARQNIINLDFDDRIKGLEKGTAGGGGSITEEQLENIKTQITEEVTTNVKSYADQSFLSKVNEDIAAEHIVFQKGITIGSFESGKSGADVTTEGNAEFRNIECDNAELSDTLIVNNIQSTDWSSEEKTGFNITTDEGKSYMEVDKLYVRLKAIFEELELRKLTHVGGNLTLSPANSTISHVEALYKLEDQSIYAYRCYFLKDDGDTRVYNNWQIGDMAKCQTFNLESVANYTSVPLTQDGQILSQDGSVVGYTTKEYVNVSNRYYWRAVVGVGESTIEGEADERIYNYVDLSNESVITLSGNINGLQGMDSLFESETDRMENDVPAKGDVIVQEGNLIDSERQNIIKLDTVGQNAPSMIQYVGVGSNSDNPYVLSKHVKVQIAGGGDNKLVVKTLEISTDNTASYKIPVDKGEYIPGTTYNYYDRVSYNGSLWLCINESGSNNTIPSTDNNEYWLLQVSKGSDGKDGVDGQDGLNGKDGVDGKDGTGVNIKGAVDFESELPTTDNQTGDAYMVDKDLYVWTGSAWKNVGQIKGDDGRDGIDGIDGDDGVSAYMHIAYANSEDGYTDFNNAASNQALYKYIGIYTDNNPTDSDNPDDYVWSLIKGADGEKGDDGYTPIIRGRAVGFHEDGGVGFYPDGGVHEGTTVMYPQATPDSDWVDIMENGNWEAYSYNLYDCYINAEDGHLYQMTETGWKDLGQYVGENGQQGPQGDPGQPGESGADAISVVLTPSTIILTQDPETNEIDFTNAVSQVKLYEGQKEILTGFYIDGIVIDDGANENTVEAGPVGDTAVVIDGIVDKPTSGKIEIAVKYGDNTYSSILQYAVNWVGVWSASIKNDVYEAVASKTFSYLDENGELVEVNGISTIEQNANSISSRVTSVENRQDTQDTNISTIEQNVDSITLTVDAHESSIETNTQNIAQLILDKNGIETRVASVENGVEQNSSSIQQNADQINLTVRGLTDTGINIEDGIITLNANNTMFEGDVTFNGVIVENMKDYPDLTTGSYNGFVPIDMENNCSLSLTNGYLVTLPIQKNTFIPYDDDNTYSIMAGGARYKNNEDQYERNENGYVPAEYSTPGTKLTIANKYSSTVGGWRYIQNKQTWRSYAGAETDDNRGVYNADHLKLLESAVMVVSDARLFNGENDSIGLVISGGFPNDTAIQHANDDTERWSNIFCCGGMIGRIIMLLPGQILKLTSSLIIIGGRERLVWNVDNPEEFTAIQKNVDIDTSWIDGTADGRIVTSENILQINTTSIGMEATGSGQDANASIFGPKILCDSVSIMNQYHIAISLTESNGVVHPKYSVEKH